ncbi:MAG: ANTAR domain-containing protein [Candidatus Moranbacteria bacterium]|nr:ANTAR domain-containing protein [Candidatus Moranbacteria bacterium]
MPSTKQYYQKKLREKKQEFDILKKITETIAYNLNLDQVLKLIVDTVQKYTKSDSCFVYLIKKNKVILEASQNPHGPVLGKIQMKLGEGITGWVAKNKKTVSLNSKAYQDKRFKSFKNILPEDKFEAFLSFPIIYKNQTVGVINVQHVKAKRYNKDRVAFLEIIARLLGGVIENARLMQETNILKEALETRKLIDKAKSILMENSGITEAQAHKLINKKSMDKRKSLKEIAEAIILSQEILS